ncbi:MAG: HAD-IIIC family phosphatase [Magnetococcales bacterium]|nr:HAD-IIIC family phosphatase [Magnetococcales bacterium]
MALVANADKRAVSEAKSAWRAHQKAVKSGEVKTNYSIGLAGSFTVESLEPFIGSTILASGFKPTIKIAAYNQLFQVCLNHTNHFSGKLDCIIIIWRIEELLANEFKDFISGKPEALQKAKDTLAEFSAAISSLRESFKGFLIVSTPPYPQDTTTFVNWNNSSTGAAFFFKTLSLKWAELLAAKEQVYILDLDLLQRISGMDSIFDARKWYLYKQPYKDLFLLQLGLAISRLFNARYMVPKKCLVMDCDNTLWGGIVGEDGLEGIQLGQGFPGSVFQDIQQMALNWREQGISLALLSKNNEGDVKQVFLNHDGMILKWQHISAWQINWQPKHENIKEIAKDLNIGVDSLVFLDDNPYEIAQMQEYCPKVTSIQVPEDPAFYPAMLAGITCFDKLETTTEDLKRASMMQAEQDREQVRNSMSSQTFLESLDLRVTFFTPQQQHIERVAQLINKTNQFNLTTVRRNSEEVQAIFADTSYRIYCIQIDDRFGEYGLTGVAIIKLDIAKKVSHLDTFLLSCRVLGRGVEGAFISAIAKDMDSLGITSMKGSFIATKKNSPAKSFLPDHGFTLQKSTNWLATIADIPPTPEYITIKALLG